MKSFTPPESVAIEARQGIRCLEQGSKAATRVGKIRARQLANRRKVSLDTIKRMKAFFDRHEKNKSYSGEPCKDKGYVSWKLWGGDSGRRWAETVIDLYNTRISDSDNKRKLRHSMIGKY